MMTVRAYAKLNLSLRVHARRKDGFHEIDSIVQTIALADQIEIYPVKTGLKVEGPFPPDTDLVHRAAALILAEKKTTAGVRIVLEKKIPVGAGLGGGSSDAAAVLMVLNRLIPPLLPSDVVDHLASSLGADVPLFCRGGRLRMMGKGEEVVPLPPGPERAFLILIPPVHCATAAVYQKYDAIHPMGQNGDLRLGINDLEEPAIALYPTLIPYQQAIARVGGEYHGMTGSGAAFYAAFSHPDRAQAAKEQLGKEFPDARVEVCTPTKVGHEEVD